ncbi:unnamed protein product [Clonostachys rosea]|uniref:Uncharacterized protein n=1 Tax=Bionectria ochroleuca TaxID=29856 RepID=A0ABY6V253_BIOOC|nr:unnamed protein product [Clonostachys rosea]
MEGNQQDLYIRTPGVQQEASQVRRSSKDLMAALAWGEKPAAQDNAGTSLNGRYTSREMEAASALASLSEMQPSAEDLEAATILMAMSRS